MKKSVIITISFFFIQGVIHNIGHPITPSFVRALGIPEFMFGVFFASMSFGLMIGGPIWGVLGDNGKKKNYIVIGLLMYSIGQFFFGYGGNIYIMVFFRFFSGLGVVASSTLLISHVIEISEKNDRSKNLAYSAAAITLGGSIGYYLGGYLGTNIAVMNFLNIVTYEKIFLIQALLNVIYALYIFIVFEETTSEIASAKKSNILSDLKQVIHIRPSLLIFLFFLTFMIIGATNLGKYIDLYFDELGYDPQQLGTFVFVTGIVSVLTAIFIVPLFAKFKRQLFAIATIQLLSAAIVFYVFRATQFLLVVYTVYMVYIVFKAVYKPLEQNYISLHAEEGKFGRVMGVRQSFLSIGMVIGPLLGGFLYQRSSLLLFDSSAFAFIIGVLLLGVVYKLEQRYQKNKETK